MPCGQPVPACTGSVQAEKVKKKEVPMADYYMDPLTGNDNFDGDAPDKAWRTLVNHPSPKGNGLATPL